MTLTFRPMRVATGWDEEGMLVLDEDERLVAVLSHLSDDNAVAPGHWYLEAGLGRLGEVHHHPTFPDLDAAQTWISRHIERA